MSAGGGLAALGLALGLGAGPLACTEDPAEPTWQIVHRELPAALLSVWGTSARDVWAVGADAGDGSGPLVIHFDGEAWSRVATGEAQGNLWWVFGFADGPVYMGGEGGLILRLEDGVFARMATPGTDTVYGIWGATEQDLWAVGGASDSSGGFAWKLEGAAWKPSAALPAEVATDAAVWKVFGTATDDVWLVGSNGVALHWDGAGLTQADTGVGSSLFTVHARDGRYAAVGGLATGIIVEYDGARWQDVTPASPPMGLSGVTLGADGFGVAVGSLGGVYTRSASGWSPAELGFTVGENFHGSWIDDEGGVWAVGGQTFSPPYDEGILIHRGAAIAGDGL